MTCGIGTVAIVQLRETECLNKSRNCQMERRKMVREKT